MKLSKYWECQECKHRFTISPTVRKNLERHKDVDIYCPRCKKTNIAQISKKVYDK